MELSHSKRRLSFQWAVFLPDLAGEATLTFTSWQVAASRSGAETGPRLTVTYRANSAVFGENHPDIYIYVQKSWGVAFLLQHVALAQLGFDLEHLDVRDSGCEQQ